MDYLDLKPGVYFLFQKTPYKVEEANFLKLQQRQPVVKAKIRDLTTGKVREQTFRSADKIEELEIKHQNVKFLYHHRGNYWFCDSANLKNRFSLNENQIGETKDYLKPNLEVKALYYHNKFLTIELPIKVDYQVIEAPPNIKGDTATSGTKPVIIETGKKIQVPFFIEVGDIIRVNTQKGEYTERVKKQKN